MLLHPVSRNVVCYMFSCYVILARFSEHNIKSVFSLIVLARLEKTTTEEATTS